jgi:hypothetical protein
MEAAPFCPRCGTAADQGGAFCARCGLDFRTISGVPGVAPNAVPSQTGVAPAQGPSQGNPAAWQTPGPGVTGTGAPTPSRGSSTRLAIVALAAIVVIAGAGIGYVALRGNAASTEAPIQLNGSAAPKDGQWVGAGTDLSFTISGGQVSSVALTVAAPGQCPDGNVVLDRAAIGQVASGKYEYTDSGAYAVANGQFKFGVLVEFSGAFDTPTSASGTYKLLTCADQSKGQFSATVHLDEPAHAWKATLSGQ